MSQTFARFFGCEANSSELTRELTDTQPITLEWATDADAITAHVAFDNVTYVLAIGEVIKLSPARFQLNYDPQDRPTNPGLVTYKFTDNLGNIDYLPVNFIGDPTPSEIPEIVYPKWGPKRVKTKEMEIEQFDPRILQDLEDRAGATMPTFCSSSFCVGRTPDEPLEDY